MMVFYKYAIIFFVLTILYWICETIYLKRTEKDDHPSRYVNEIFYEEIIEADKH